MRPVDVEVSFDDRTYQLGDNIDLTIELTPRRDCQVREARVDLIVEERWTEQFTQKIEVPIRAPSGRYDTGGGTIIGTETKIKENFVNYKEKTVHSTIMFLRDRSLISGRSTSHQPRLQVGKKPPRLARPTPRQTKARMTWWVQTVIDVQGARDVKPRTKIDVSVAPGRAG